jgi:hypothetical protein
LIATDLYQQGNFEAAALFVEEANVDIPPETVAHFTSLSGVINGLRQYQLEPALTWCAEHEDQLASIGSAVYFKASSLRYLQILQVQSGGRVVMPLLSLLLLP